MANKWQLSVMRFSGFVSQTYFELACELVMIEVLHYGTKLVISLSQGFLHRSVKSFVHNAILELASGPKCILLKDNCIF